MNLFNAGIDNAIETLVQAIQTMGTSEKISALNQARKRLHEISPFKDEPIDCVLWVPADKVLPNEYNPNSVAPPEMQLLRHSIDCDGYTQPVVTWESSPGEYKIVDGEHRWTVGKKVKRIQARIYGRVPVTVIRENRGGEADRMAATIRHNRARGTHAVTSMTDIVSSMLGDGGLGDHDVAFELGMDADELLRFKQNIGMPELFKDHDFSSSWEVE